LESPNPVIEPSEPPLPEVVAAEEKETKTSPVFRFLWEVFQTLAMALILFFLVDTFVARAKVENISMLPTLHPGTYLMVNKFAYQWGSLQRGDIIVFHYPPDPGVDYIKRMIGIPGDDVKMVSGQLYINGQKINETFNTVPATYSGEWVVPPGMIFALGDNRDLSSDSHKWGFVPLSDLVGRAIVVYFPFDQIKLLNDTIHITP
jgi:signal peptidase I